MLHRVAEYVDRNAVAYRPGYKCKFARFAIHCDRDGKLLGVDSLVTEDARKGRTFTSAPDFTFSEIKAGKHRKSHFLIDSADSVALLGESKEPGVQQKHEYFWQMIQVAAKTVPQLNPLRHLSSAIEAIRSELKDAGAKPSDLVTFRVASGYVLESECWHDWWNSWRLDTVEAQSKDKRVVRKGGPAKVQMVSYLSGKAVQAAETHPKLNPLPGGVTAALRWWASTNRPFFHSVWSNLVTQPCLSWKRKVRCRLERSNSKSQQVHRRDAGYLLVQGQCCRRRRSRRPCRPALDRS